jgi:transcriptional regulator with XRE-family HTH domain
MGWIICSLAIALKDAVAWQIQQAMEKEEITRVEMARRMKTSRAALDRLLAPGNGSVTLQTLTRAARAIGRDLRIELVKEDPRADPVEAAGEGALAPERVPGLAAEVTSVISIDDVRHWGDRVPGSILDLEAEKTLRGKENGDERDGIGFGGGGSRGLGDCCKGCCCATADCGTHGRIQKVRRDDGAE